MPRGIDRNVTLLGWVSYFTDMASAMVNPLLPLFVVAVLHEGMDKLGFIVAVATFLSYTLRLFSGYLSDRFGIVKPLVVGGYLLSALSKPLLGFAASWQSVALLRGAERVGKGVRSAPKDLLIARYSGPNREGMTFGFHKTLDIAGELSGSLLLFGLLLWFGSDESVLRTLFLATLFPGLVGLILLFFVRDAPKPAAKPLRFLLTPADRAVIKTLGFYFLFLLFIFSDAFFTMRAVGAGFEAAIIPLLFIVSTAVQTLFSYPLGKLVDRIGERQIMTGAYLCGVTAQALLFQGGTLAVWFAYGFLGLFTVASLNANRAYIARQAENRGSVYGIFYAGVALFAAAGAVVCGMLWNRFGADSALLFSLVGTAIVTAVYLLAGRLCSVGEGAGNGK
jgi:MFS family permease